METIFRVTTDKRRYLSLLLDADPSEDMLARYLEAGEMYVLAEDGEVLCEAVVLRLPFRQCELKNLATSPAYRRRGCASRLLAYLFQIYAQTCDLMWVGTAEAGVGFYQRFGFSVSHTLKHFFTRNYLAPIYEDGQLCEDMHCLVKSLRPAENTP